MSDLIERLRQLASNTGKMTWVNDLPMPATAVLHNSADEIEALTTRAEARESERAALIEGAGELVVRLRARARLTDLQANQDAFLEAAATIAAMRAEFERAKEALKPFADCVEQIAPDEDDEEWAKFRLLIKDYRRAARALSAEAIAMGEG